MVDVEQLTQQLLQELQFAFIRASGPGGQNVNKVSSAVQLRFDISSSPTLTLDQKTRLVKIAGNRVTSEGVFVIEAKRYREQERNRDDALQRFKKILLTALVPPPPRKPTRIPRAEKKSRLLEKRKRSEVKHCRKLNPKELD